MAGRVDGKVALVTGGAKGLGKADCEYLAKEGASVIVADIDDSAAAAVAEAIDGKALHLDVADESDWQSAYTAIERDHGGLDILVNNAGIVIPSNVEQTSLSDFRKQFAIHADGTFLGCHYGIPLMAKSGGGSIINMASVSAIQGYAAFFAYGAAKGAILSMTRSIALHCQDESNDIRCNVIMPGGIETPMIETVAQRPGQPMEIPDGILPFGALGAAKDVAQAVLYLASDESRFVSGTQIVIDNAATIRPAG